MEARGILPEKVISKWRGCCYGEEFPIEDRTEIVLFRSIYEKGFSLPARAFFRWLLYFYGLKWGKYLDVTLKDRNNKWVEEWFVVANPAPSVLPRTGLPAVFNEKWEEMPTEEEMVQVKIILAELLTQPIQERVHLGYEYLGCNDPTRVQNCKVSRVEGLNRVYRIMSGEVRDKGCLKAHCLKQPTTKERVMEYWFPAPLPEGQDRKVVERPSVPTDAAEVFDCISGSSAGSEPEVEIVGAMEPAAGAGTIEREAQEEEDKGVPKDALKGGPGDVPIRDEEEAAQGLH
ncbi:hypothetical protein C2845_PM02G15390 [Panicum miliaceum]|uniref:Uncharacterized protein n=1 Tax=Panicum miliaceum TaxID=4540 RepID=A0A3L6SED8_PANMI|nr:hypothetical protein C2845_PM02G15390 [Panicum miliaceum]